MYRNTYVEIDVKRLEKNIKNIIKKNSDYKYYIGVVKGNAYGHGMEFCKWIIKNGINYLAVATLDEAMEIRESIKEIPILVLQPVDINYLDVCSDNNITITISSYDYYLKIKSLNTKLKIHLKIDSGMNRLGINKEEQVTEIYNYLINSNNFILEGIYTHLATLGIADDRFDKQINKFLRLTKSIDLNKIEIVHLYSSNAFIIHPKLSWANGVRLGIIMYGLSPRNFDNKGINKLKEIKRNLTRKKLKLSSINDDFTIDVKPCLELISEVSEIKEVDKDNYVGYGYKYITSEKSLIAIVPVGYMDGLSLNNSGRSVYINNKPYEIVGVINMGMITVKVDGNVKVGDRVEVIKNIREEANYSKTTSYQYLTSISPSLERKYIIKEK